MAAMDGRGSRDQPSGFAVFAVVVVASASKRKEDEEAPATKVQPGAEEEKVKL